MFDVMVIGGGPAGLSAALMLGRCRRNVFLCDAGHPRNAASRALHGYLTRDGIAPGELVRLGRHELAAYHVETRHATVTDLVCVHHGFESVLSTDERIASKTVLIATGVRDDIPSVAGLLECYGISVHHCPYCDGWEARDRKLVVLGAGRNAGGLALALKTWSGTITLCSNGPARLGSADRERLLAHHVDVREAPISRIDHRDGRVERIVFTSAEPVACDAIFLATTQRMQWDMPRRLGCEITHKGVVKTNNLGQTRVPGLYVVGDASRDVQFAVIAAAEGAKAAVAINRALQQEAGLGMQQKPSTVFELTE